MKGISPLIASVLLIAVTVALSTIIMGWVGTTTSDTTSTVSNKTSEAVSCASADISIDSVYIVGTTARAIVKNSGFSDNVRLISAVLVNNTGESLNTSTTLDTDFDRGEIISVLFSSPTISCANFTKVIVSTSCGSVNRMFDGVPKGC
jgi:flagellin-like protein